MPAMWAILTIREPDRSKVLNTRLLILEIIRELREGLKLKCVFHSGSSLPYLLRVVKCQKQIFVPLKTEDFLFPFQE